MKKILILLLPIIGMMQAEAYPYIDDVQTVQEVPYSPSIFFFDTEVKRICVENWDTDKNGELSYDEAAQVTSIWQFHGSTIVTFDELQYFTGLESIDENAFSGCTNLQSITLPENLLKIGSFAFWGCISLATIEIPASVAEVGWGSFFGCSSLESIRMSGVDPPQMGSHVQDDGSISFDILSGREFEITLYVPIGAKDVYRNAEGWSNFWNIVDIEVDPTACIQFSDAEVKRICVENWDTNGDGELSYAEAAAVTQLGEVFKGNKSIRLFDELVNFTGLTTIADSAFKYCTTLASVRIPSNVGSICNYAFYGCDHLGVVNIPSGLTLVEPLAFTGCAGFEVVSGNSRYDSRNNCNSIIETNTNKLIIGSNSSTIPSSVTSIGYYAFLGCTGLKSITIPFGVTIIDRGTFYGCSGLTSVTIPNSVTIIGADAFSGCSSLVFRGLKTTINDEKHIEINLCISTTFRF